ncbi:basement membrane-specific heparan sulfate proteoglycan core protein isoform X4 [Tiliqua scincoides]|uniref:basement membrane-specific heparan sulfate proteoglycan core protein isoform X4 n=1 Tax=Tiliqua scincoides TaxID=71010 RepID=UPI0034622E59
MGAGKAWRRLPGGARTGRCRLRLPLLLAAAALLSVAHASQGLDEASFPEDTESEALGQPWQSYADFSDDEDLLADEASGDGYGSGENGSGTAAPIKPLSTVFPVFPTAFPAPPPVGLPPPASMTVSKPEDDSLLIYFRALVNFTRSIDYSPRLDDVNSEEFRDVSEAVVDTLESEYYKIPGEQVVSVVFIKEIDGYVFVELDVGSEGNVDEDQIREVLLSVIEGGSIASYVTSTWGFQFRRLGAVPPDTRPCTEEEFTCRSGECVAREFLCDQRPDCRDMSDELDCAEPAPPECAEDAFACDSGECVPLRVHCDGHPDCRDASDEDGCGVSTPPPVLRQEFPLLHPSRPVTTRVPATTPSAVTTRRAPATVSPRTSKPPPHPGVCQKDEVACANRQCIPRDYLCDGERDCLDGSDELDCGTPSPCEPNEFKCRNGPCTLKLWRCDGDNDCPDGFDELNCPTKGPGDTCGPEQFVCVSTRTCIPAGYQCDNETDCPDRSDEIGCTAPQVITPPEESIQAAPGETIRFSCVAIGVPTPIITWRLNWGHIPSSHRVSITSENGHGTLVIRDVKESDQGAYTCEAINARGMIFGIPDGVLSLTPGRGPCPTSHFHVKDTSRCLPCFCFGITKACQGTSRHRSQVRLRFDRPEDFKGVNVTTPSQPGVPPLSSTQLQVEPGLQEFQLVDLSRRFLAQESFWMLPSQFLGNKVDSYGGYLRFKVRYGLARGQSDPVQKPGVVIVGNGQKLIYRVQVPTQPSVVNQRQVLFIEENWEKESGAPVSREELLLVLQNLQAIQIQTVYDSRMASVGLSDIAMDTTTTETTDLGLAHGVEECRCPAGYSGLSCERCDAHFERVPGGPYLGTCSGCSCNGHSSSCDRITGYCLNCQHNTEGPQCNKCKLGYFGDATKGTPSACQPCPCPYTEASRRFSTSCFLDTDGQATCDDCAAGHTGRRCERCAPGYEGNPIQPGGRCLPVGQEIVRCDERGSSASLEGACQCKPNVMGRLCNECATGTFHLSHKNPDGCLRCFCMGVSRQCASSSWSRDQVRVAHEDDTRKAQVSLSNAANTRTVSEGIRFTSPLELAFSSFHTLPRDVYYWVLPEHFKADKVTSYGGELHYTITHSALPGSPLLRSQPNVLLQGNGIFLEHLAEAAPLPGVPTAFTVPFREQAWRRADGQNATREHLLMALADIDVLMIRASYAERQTGSRISGIRMDVAVPRAIGLSPALEVEECACPPGYRGPSCQDCDVGYMRTTHGLYLGTCEPCACNGHATECDPETGDCQGCQHNTEGSQCERCQLGFFGDAKHGTPQDCQPCPCHGPYSASQATKSCFLDTDGEPTCISCAQGYAGRHCERCAPGYVGDPGQGQPCTVTAGPGTGCQCNPQGSISSYCDTSGQCQCKAHVEGPSCSRCRPHHFHLSAENREGCLPCFCMGITQQCTSSSYYRDLVTSPFLPGNPQGFALVNRQRSTRLQTGFVVELSSEGPQLSYGQLAQLGQESYYWQLPETYLGDKKETYFARMRRAHKQNSTSLTEEQLRKDVAAGRILSSVGAKSQNRQASEADEVQMRQDARIWEMLSHFALERRAPAAPQAATRSRPLLSALPRSFTSFVARAPWLPSSLATAPGSHPQGETSPRAPSQDTSNLLSSSSSRYHLRVAEAKKYRLLYQGFSLLPEITFYWELPKAFLGDQVGSYGGRLHYTLSYNVGRRGTPLPDADVQITGNDITLVAYQPALQPQERKSFNIVFREQHWKRPDGQPATREHLMMALADLDEILIRATHSTDMVSASITGVSLEMAVPTRTSLPQALEVEECRCPPGYQGLSCQDCAAGYTRTGGGLYLGHCALCECNGHSDSCHPETGACSNCLHNAAGEFCELCAPGFYGDATAGTPEDCQPCACPLLEPENQFSQTCQSLGAGGYHCTACQPGYTGQYCEQCAPGYTGNPSVRGQKCVPLAPPDQPPLIVQVHPPQTSVPQGSEVTLQCHASGTLPHYFYWSREDGRPVPSTAQRRRQGMELHFPSIQPFEAGVYLCTCRNLQHSNTSRAEVVVSELPSKPITVTVEEKTVQSVKPGADVTFVCTAKSKSPAYTLVWTRQNHGKLPSQAMDFNGILTIRNVQPEDAGVYVCTGSNMFDMDEGMATLYVQAPSKTQMFYGPLEVLEGHRPSAPAIPPMATIEPPQLSVQPGQPAEFRCVATGSPQPTVEWIGGQGGVISPKAIVQGGVLRFLAVEPSDESQYLCRVRNSAGQHLARAFLQVHSASVPQVQVSPERLEVQEGSTVRLYCRAAGSPAATITWEKQGGSLPAQAVPVSGFFHLQGGSLQVLQQRLQELQQSRAERTDIATLVIPSITAADGGTYFCVGSSAAGTGQARIEVVVLQASGSSPSLKIEPSSSSVIEGETLDLNCVLSGQPAAVVMWFREGNALPARHQVSGSVLRIPHISPDDSGKYICRAHNGAGTKEASITVTVQRATNSSHGTSLVRIESPSPSVSEGQTVDLECLVGSYLQPRVTWYKLGGTLPANHQITGHHLRIFQATVADSGEYVCRVSEGGSNARVQEASLMVIVYDSSQSAGITPPVRIQSSAPSLIKGQTLDLHCITAGHHQRGATIRWYKRGGSLPANHQVSGSHLRIPQASTADSGEYVCHVSLNSVVREAAVIVSSTSSSTLSVTPSMKIEASSPHVAEGQTLELDCILAHREQQATVTWYKRGGTLPPSHQAFGSRLRLVQVTPVDSGEYVCQVGQNAATQDASVFVTVQQGSADAFPAGVTPPVRIESSSTSPAEGHTLDLKCIVAGPAARGRVTWHKRGGALPAMHQVSGPILRIPQASAADSGEYVCHVSDGTVVHEASLVVTIQGGPGSSYAVGVTPPIRIETSSPTVIEGQTVDLNCLVATRLQSRVKWYKRGGALPIHSQILGSRLRILQASAADSGEYVCYVSEGTSPLEASVVVSIPSSSSSTSSVVPPVRIKSSSSSLTEGQTLELNCLVSGQVNPEVTWLMRGGPLPANHQVSGTRLRIPHVSAANSGEYVCRVSSTAVTQEAVLVVTVQDSEGPSPHPSGAAAPLRIKPSSPSVVEGQSLNLTCVAPGLPQATFAWYRREGPLPARHRVSNGQLQLVQLVPADSGEYVCQAAGGSASPREASFVVTVLAGTSVAASAATRLQSPIISIDPHSLAVRRGADVSFRCRVHDGAQPIELSWKLPHNQLEDNVEISPTGSVITISNAHPKNQGAYRCVATNRYGIANSMVNLMVQGPPTVSVMPEGSVRVKVGKSISLDCLGSGEPRVLVRWSKVGVRQKVEHQTLLPLESRAVLKISSAKLEDAGTYVCMAQNTLGTAEAQVDVSVEAVHGRPGVPEVTVNPTQTVVAGQTARLQCSATGDPMPTIHWSKLRAPLPWQHQVENGTLIIPRAAQQDSGQYICNASNSAGFTEAFIVLDVETPPYATSLPDVASIRAGEALQLQCLAHGTPPLRYEWTKANGSLSGRAMVREGILHISPTTRRDSGTYRCLVSNRVGSAEALAQVQVQGSPGSPPSVRVTPQSDTKAVGGTAEFVCSVEDGDPQAQIEWFREDGELPPTHSISNGVLRIEKLDRGCQGVYVCRVSSPDGQAQDSARLTVQALPKVMINIRTSVQTVLTGSAVEFECLAFGDPRPQVTWSKVGGRLRPEVLVSGGTVKIERVEQSDAGQYRCTATNNIGTVQSHVILHVQSVPQIAAQPEVKEVTAGSGVVFPCLASGFPVPEVAWTKLEGDLPKNARMEGNVLSIPSAHPEDTGIYVCTASNRQGKVTAFSMLKVRERVVPYFTQNPQSYLILPTMKDAYKTFAIEITFRPDTPDGLLLYNGQKKNTGADFVSFGLVGGRPELRFDAGSGMATIRHPSILKLGEFHTVRLYRNLTQGSLVLDNHPPVNGTSQGRFQGLNLNEGLYLGGYPNYAAIAKTSLSSGFIGCVRQLLVQGKEVIFKDFDLQAHGVSSCPTCQDQPCQNGGTCRNSESSSYICECPQGFAGSNCEHPQALRCHPEACGPDATCVNRATGQGYVCRCLLGKYGERCTAGATVTTPSFHGDGAFISYPPLTNIHYELRLDLEIKPLSPDGLILFSGGNGGPGADFVSLSMAGGHLEFSYELGSGTAILQSVKPLALGQWHRVMAERMNKDGTLQVDDERPVKRSSPGKSQGLNLRTSLYLGGVDEAIQLPAAANVSSPFSGCIGEVSINGKKVDLSYSFLESRSISQCYDNSPCDRRPCRHGGKCLPTGEFEFQCLCLDGYQGERCEVSEDRCQHPCLNGGVCKEAVCVCPPGVLGQYCEHDAAQPQLNVDWTSEGSGEKADAPGQYGAYFQDGGYVALPQHTFPRSLPDLPETIEMEVRTTSPSGLLLWQGVKDGESGKAKDFISLGLQDGHLVFSYQLGSGEANILSEDPIDDGEWHRVMAIREGKKGFLQVDGEEMVSGESPGKNVMVNTRGHVYLGGAPHIQALTAGKYRSGINGCLKNVVLLNARPGQQPQQPIDFQHQVEASFRTQECPL